MAFELLAPLPEHTGVVLRDTALPEIGFQSRFQFHGAVKIGDRWVHLGQLESHHPTPNVTARARLCLDGAIRKGERTRLSIVQQGLISARPELGDRDDGFVFLYSAGAPQQEQRTGRGGSEV